MTQESTAELFQKARAKMALLKQKMDLLNQRMDQLEAREKDNRSRIEENEQRVQELAAMVQDIVVWQDQLAERLESGEPDYDAVKTVVEELMKYPPEEGRKVLLELDPRFTVETFDELYRQMGW